ncbi:MAG: PHP domain-containing protein [Paludisphaera borealis]|uniref:PHP domain-containing protein n=1 Tax=Paludisphaera borealis TaxID=1387353 RepID=UPI00283FBB6F|nr:PHP domain-containing protein [Paludisphaera borealis]MDR3622750.1 PHP domain-containing protein [Paludisphaera borealis]
MIRRNADLHVHTTHSDGFCSPAEVVVAAAGVGLAALAITDHDTISALAVARPEADRLGVELISGVELTCEYDGREIHVLGYFFRDDDPDLLDAMSRLRIGRASRFQAMAERLTELGMVVDLAAVRRCFPRAVLGRRHLAEYLARTKQVAGVREAFDRFLADGRPACAAKLMLDAREAIGLIRNAGGVASWAHPPYNLRLESLRTLAEAGLQAIETAGPGIQNRVGRRFRDWAETLDLVPTAGSDFHAPDRPGRWVGAITTSDADLDRLRGRRPSNPASA